MLFLTVLTLVATVLKSDVLGDQWGDHQTAMNIETSMLMEQKLKSIRVETQKLEKRLAELKN